jgi:type I restriction-modification system DNA methylase subunit
MNNFGQIANFIWSIAELLRDRFKRGKYQDVLLPFTVLRRIDCVLEPMKPKVLDTHAKLKGKLDNLDPQLRKASGFAFYNTSKYDFEKLLDDAPNLATNLRAYLNGFSENMREVLDRFDFHNTIAELDEYGLPRIQSPQIGCLRPSSTLRYCVPRCLMAPLAILGFRAVALAFTPQQWHRVKHRPVYRM